VELTYIRDNLSNFNEVEKQEFIDTLSRDRRNPYGTLLSIIRNPNRTRLGLNIQIKLNKTTSENISSVIRSILAEYEEKLQRIIDFEEIENKIADLGYIKSVRVTNTLQVWAISTFYTRLDFTVETTGCAEPKFEFFRHLRRSADFEPIWPLIEGDRVQDGRVIWEARDERTCNLPAWEPEIDYQIGAKVIPTAGPGTLIYVCVKRENLSNTFEPVWNDAIGSITMDRELIWMAVEVSGTPSIWQAEYNYELGDTVYPTSSTDYALQVVGYRSRSGMTPPVWPIIGNIQFEDGDIRWMSRDRDRATVTLNWDEYTLINESLSIG
jgi:metal-sulfur cluster biosynthetic enzyme